MTKWLCFNLFRSSHNEEEGEKKSFYPLGILHDVCLFPKFSKLDEKSEADLGLCGHTSWSIFVEKTTVGTTDPKTLLSVELKGFPAVRATSNYSDKWSIEADVFVNIVGSNENMKGQQKVKFDRDNFWSYVFDVSNLSFEMDAAELQVGIGITSIQNLYSTNFHDFSSSEKSDFTLIVEEKKFHVSKEILALNSSYFRTMFISNFTESGKEEVELVDVDSNSFHTLLQYLYMAPIKICDENVRDLLDLSDRFIVKRLNRECENYLLQSDMAEGTIIEIASFYHLDRVLCEIISKKKTVEQLICAFPNLDNLPPTASMYLMARIHVDDNGSLA